MGQENSGSQEKRRAIQGGEMMRSEFEKIYRETTGDSLFERYQAAPHRYDEDEVDIAWVIWQASAAQYRQVIEDVLKTLETILMRQARIDRVSIGSMPELYRAILALKQALSEAGK